MTKTLARMGLASAAGLCTLGALAGPVVSFTPSTQHANIGDTVVVDVTISGLDAEILSAFDLNFLWNPAVMGASRFFDASSAQGQLGSAWAEDPVWAIDSTAAGNWGVQVSALADNASIAAHQLDSFLLAHFTFSADANGVTSFSLGGDPDFERNFVGLDPSTSLDVTIGSACVAVGSGSCTVPEPASHLLVLLALAGTCAPAVWRRRQRSG